METHVYYTGFLQWLEFAISYFCIRKFFRLLIDWWRVATRHQSIGGRRTGAILFSYFCGQRRSWGTSGMLSW